MKEQQRWLKSIIFAVCVFLLFSVYLYLRRGYYNLYIINKVLGSTAALIAGFTLIIGPLAQKISLFKNYTDIRKHLGLLALYLGIGHVIASLAQTSRFKFPAWFLEEWIPVGFGVLTILIWYFMKRISTPQKINKMGLKVWQKTLSNAGKLGFLAVFLHLVILKYPGWIRWFNGQTTKSADLANPSYPPASLFVFFILLAIILYRIYTDYLSTKKK